MIMKTTRCRPETARLTAATPAVIAALICLTACGPRQNPEPPETGRLPAIVRVHSFARNEVRLDVVANGEDAFQIKVGRQVRTVALDPVNNPELRLAFKAGDSGFSVTNPAGSVDIQFAELSDVVFLEPPFDDGREVLLGTCRRRAGGSVAIRIGPRGPGGVGCEMPSWLRLEPIEPFDLTSYRLQCLPAMRDFSAAIAEIRREKNSDDYALCVPHYKPVGRSFMGEACWTLTMWPPNASECASYMVTVNLPDNRNSIWQVFVIDPDSGEIFLIRDRRTGELISLGDWLELEEKTAVYTLDEMLRGVCDEYQERQRNRGT